MNDRTIKHKKLPIKSMKSMLYKIRHSTPQYLYKILPKTYNLIMAITFPNKLIKVTLEWKVIHGDAVHQKIKSTYEGDRDHLSFPIKLILPMTIWTGH